MQTIQLTIKKLDYDVTKDEFNCGNSSVNKMVEGSYFPTLLQYAYAYKVCLEDTVIGYYMIKLKSIYLNYGPNEFKELDPSVVNDFGAIQIKYIAVDEKYQHNGYGTYILKFIIADTFRLCPKLPITVITLEALKERYTWYLERGFSPFDEQELTDTKPTIQMYISCLPDKKAVNDYCNSLV